MKIKTLIVDDEPLARSRIRNLLEAEPDVEVVGECENGLEAIEAIASRHPDLVFLDVQMPGLDGFGVVEKVGPAHMPASVFVTAFDEFAIQAFDAQALDYLLKPFAVERFQHTLARARARLSARRREALESRLEALL
jgi:two-component system, LytTR family, response regulator